MSACGCSGSLPCGCCEGTHAVTPESEFNRPGLDALSYRAGTHSTFLESMEDGLAADRRLDGLSTRDSLDGSIAMLDAWATVGDVLAFYQERIANEGYLATATERRSVMELGNLIGYHPRPGISASVFLAYTMDKDAKGRIPAGSLVRSTPDPGENQQAFETSEDLYAEVAWNNLQVRLTQPPTRKAILRDRAVYLKGLVSAVKKDDPLMVQFADQDVLLCRVVSMDQDAAAGRTRIGLENWSSPGTFPVDFDSALADVLRIFLRLKEFDVPALNTTVKAVVALLRPLVQSIDAGVGVDGGDLQGQITALGANTKSQKVQQWIQQISAALKSKTNGGGIKTTTVDQIASQAGLLTQASLAPRSQYNRVSDLRVQFDAPTAASMVLSSSNGEGTPQMVLSAARLSGSALSTLAAFRPAFRDSLATALLNAQVTVDPVIKVYTVLRSAAFGYNAAPKPSTAKSDTRGFVTSWNEWPFDSPDATRPDPGGAGGGPIMTKVDLDKEYDKVTRDTLVAIQQGAHAEKFFFNPAVSTVPRAAYGLSGKVTRLNFAPHEVLTYKEGTDPTDLGFLRPVKVFLADTALPLAKQPISDPVCGTDPEIELDTLYEGLTAGKWIILDGERADTAGTSGVRATELLLIAGVSHRASTSLPGDRIHTFLDTVVPSSYCYKRSTLNIYGNVVKATNGETRKEVLGSGDATVPFPSFPLKQPPLTFLAAPTGSGAASTLKVYVNDREWHEVDSPVGLAPYDRSFFTQTADDGTTTVVFGNGITGARIPTGAANLRTAYRNDIGKGGNVKSGQLNILGSKPAGVKGVNNPLRASGGADKDPRDRMRENAPLTMTALDRLVSVTDYAHFSQTFAGIGKASAVPLTNGQRALVHVTIAGIDDIPIDAESDLYLNLRRALHLLGDPHQALQLDVRFAKFLVLEAGVKVNPDYPWETVAPKLTVALQDAFSFERRKLGQNAYLSEVLDVLQRVPGVEFIDPTAFGSIMEADLTPSGIVAAIANLKLANVVRAHLARTESAGIAPAEIAYFTPDVPATIALNQL